MVAGTFADADDDLTAAVVAFGAPAALGAASVLVAAAAQTANKTLTKVVRISEPHQNFNITA